MKDMTVGDLARLLARPTRWVAALWLLVMGVAPFAWPKHDTFTDPLTWLDWGLHIVGGLWVYWLAANPRRRRTVVDANADHPSVSEYVVTLADLSGPGQHVVLTVDANWRHAYILRDLSPEANGRLAAVFSDDPDGPEEIPEMSTLVAAWDRIGSAVWVDGHGEALFVRRSR